MTAKPASSSSWTARDSIVSWSFSPLNSKKRCLKTRSLTTLWSWHSVWIPSLSLNTSLRCACKYQTSHSLRFKSMSKRVLTQIIYKLFTSRDMTSHSIMYTQTFWTKSSFSKEASMRCVQRALNLWRRYLWKAQVKAHKYFQQNLLVSLLPRRGSSKHISNRYSRNRRKWWVMRRMHLRK